ncbi:MAG: ABC transporter permease [Flavobacteriia bacterium]|nr:ABC transporter permease [Flavobacteriia bacterium]
MLKNWTKIFIHHIKHNKLFTILNTFGLGIGIAGLIFAVLYWNDEHSYNQWNSEKENVFQTLVKLGSTDDIWANNPAPIGPLLKKKSNKITSFCYLESYYTGGLVKYKGKKLLFSKITSAQKNFFSYFPFTQIYGSINAYKKDKIAVALALKTAKQLFGNENPIGKQILIEGNKHIVKLVYEIPGKSSIASEIIINTIDDRIKTDGNESAWGNYNYGLLLKLKNPKDKAIVEQEIENLYFENVIKPNAKNGGITTQKYIKQYGENTVYLEQLKTDRINAMPVGLAEGKGNYQFLLIMMGISLLILILSIVNYINLSTANAIKRAKEVGIRKIVGATKRNIISQFIFETVIITLFSIMIALSIVEITLPYYNAFLEKEFLLSGSQFFIQLIIIFGLTVIVAGIFPAIYVANFDTTKVIKGNFGRSKQGVWIRNSMLIFQFTIATFFIIGTSIVHEQIKYMNSKDLGFKGEQILEIYYPRREDNQLYERYVTVKKELLKIQGVKQVSSGAFTFGNGASSTSGFSYNDVNIQGHNMAVDYEMLEMLNVKMKSGRFFNKNIASDATESVIINETTLKMMKEKNPVGKIINWNDKQLKIIGVVKDFHLMGLQTEIPPMVFFHYKTIDWMIGNLGKIAIKISAQNQTKTLGQIEKFWKKNINQDYPFDYTFIDKQFAQTYKEYVSQRNLFSILNIVVILIALFGLFALVSFSVERRMKEIAIRKTLGAETKELLFTLTKQYFIFCVFGFICAILPVFYLLQLWLENFAYRIEMPITPYVLSFFFLLTLTLIVVLGKAYQATKVDVLYYLKYE